MLWIFYLNLRETQSRALEGKLESGTSRVSQVTSAASQSIAVRAKHKLPIFHRLTQMLSLNIAFSLGLSTQLSKGKRHLRHLRPLPGQWTTAVCSELPGIVRPQTVPDMVKKLETLKKNRRCTAQSCPSYSPPCPTPPLTFLSA